MRGHNSFIFKVISGGVANYSSYQIRYFFTEKGYDYEIEVITLSNSFARVDSVFVSHDEAMNQAHSFARNVCDILNRSFYEKV